MNEDIGATGFTVNVKLSGPTNKNVTFDYGMTDLTTTKISDYTEETNRTVTISIGQTTGSFSIPIVNDMRNEGNEKFTLTLSDLTNAVFDGAMDEISKTVTILDDELPILSISTTNFSLFEDDQSNNFILEVMLNGETEQDVTFDYGIADITTSSNVDYIEESNRSITILAGNTTGSISIPIVDDAEIEENESFVVTLFNLSGAKFTSGSTLSQTISIIDDDARTLSFSDTELRVAENVGSSGLEVTLTLSATINKDVTFDFSMLDGSTTKGSDYSEVTNRTVTISANTNTGSFTIPILNDDITESSESFTIYLFNLVGANFVDGNSILSKPVIITDDETPTIAITTTNFNVGEDAGTSGITVGVELLNTSSYAVSFNYAAESITAMMGTDFPSTSGTVTIAASDTTGSFSIPISEDTEGESTETFKIKLSAQGGAQFATTSTNTQDLIVSILDNDVPTISIAGGPPVTESDTVGSPAIARFTISSPIQPATNMFMVNYTPVGSSFIANSGTSIRSSALNFTDPDNDGIYTAELPITILSDSSAEENGNVVVTLNTDTPGSEKYYVGSPASAKVVVNDDDASIPVLSIVDITNSITESQGEAVFTINADRDPGRSIKVRYTPAEVEQGDFLTDAMATPTTTASGLTFTTTAPYTSSLRVPFHNDQIAEASGKIRVTLNDDPANPDTYTVASGSNAYADAMISDDDTSLTLSFNDPNPSIMENVAARKIDIVVNLSSAASSPVVINYETADVTAMSGSDFTGVTPASNTSITIAEGATTGTISIPITNDTDSEGNETFTLSITNLSGANFSSGVSYRQTITIIDDEGPSIDFVDTPLSVREDVTSGKFEVTVQLSGPSNQRISVDYRTSLFTNDSNGIADFTSTNGTLIFEPGNTTTKFEISITNDTESEKNETFQITLSNIVGTATFPENVNLLSTTVIIIDDETPTLSITNTHFNNTEDSSDDDFYLTVKLSHPVTTDVTFDISLADGTGKVGLDYNRPFHIDTYVTSGRIIAGSRDWSVWLPTINDEIYKGDKTYTVTLSNLVGANFDVEN